MDVHPRGPRAFEKVGMDGEMDGGSGVVEEEESGVMGVGRDEEALHPHALEEDPAEGEGRGGRPGLLRCLRALQLPAHYLQRC